MSFQIVGNMEILRAGVLDEKSGAHVQVQAEDIISLACQAVNPDEHHPPMHVNATSIEIIRDVVRMYFFRRNAS
jgi:hypothetical protein